MIERAAHTTFYVGLTVVEGDKAWSKTKREAKRRKNDTCETNHSGHISTEIVSSARLQKSASSTSAFFATLRFR